MGTPCVREFLISMSLLLLVPLAFGNACLISEISNIQPYGLSLLAYRISQISASKSAGAWGTYQL